jgi:hypothetical protein
VDDQETTRLWLGGMEVDFVKWMPTGLIYTRVGSQETIAHLPRASVQRLLQDGTLRIEGYRPGWAFDDRHQPPS